MMSSRRAWAPYNNSGFWEDRWLDPPGRGLDTSSQEGRGRFHRNQDDFSSIDVV